MSRAIVLSVVLVCASVVSAAAQTTLSANPVVVPAGSAATLTITGPPGHFVALGGSTVGGGLAFGGFNLALGPDVQVITIVQLDGAGHATIPFAPPFAGTTLDRFYLQAVSSPSPTILPPTPSNGVILRNADALAVPVGGDVTGTFPNLTLTAAAGASIVNAINSTGGAPNFSQGLSANNAQIINVGNPVAPTDAVNKAYADASFVKFAPGAEQLSVGDANGTGTMINLRGGATCCSGPGGHSPAFFKVFQNGSFVFTGNLGIGVSPMEGKGYRTSWHTYKGAFRSGYADNEWNDANVGFFSWAGGSNSTASGLYAFAFGDTNAARSTSSIAFGSGNEVKGAAGFSAGAGNSVCDTYGVAFGNNAQSGGPLVAGNCDPDSFNITGLAAVAIGYNVTADKDHTTAMGKFASNNGYSGTFAWSDGAATSSADTFRNTANNQFAVRATGGVRFITNLAGTTGAVLASGGSGWMAVSDINLKTGFKDLDGEEVLTKLARMPIQEWSYKGYEGVRHVGPYAQDFWREFGLGDEPLMISTIDPSGIALRAVQALDARTRSLMTENDALRAETDALRAETATLRAELEAIRALLQKR